MVTTTATEAEAEMATQLFIALGRLSRWSARQSPEQYGPGVLSALGTVVDRGRVRLGELAGREGVSPASLSRTISILEAEALISRSIDPDDRRSSFVEATAVGTGLVLERRRQRGELLAARLAPLNEHQLLALQKLVQAIEELACT
jgi:DNA-binding MarR family transcriptional regulator